MFEITQVTCPICGSDKVRSKTCTKDGEWYYICDNYEFKHELLLDGKNVIMTERFYFNEDGTKLEYGDKQYKLA